jgi:hypothetical protein
MNNYVKDQERMRANKIKEIERAKKDEQDRHLFLRELNELEYSKIPIVLAYYKKEAEAIHAELQKPENKRNYKMMNRLKDNDFRYRACCYRIEYLQRDYANSCYTRIG